MMDDLFVYGSLCSWAGHPNGARLGREAAALKPARIVGKLYRISWYPGLVPSDDPRDVVHGELVTLRDAAASLVWLDAYENLDKSDEYERVRRAVSLDDGTRRDAWVYLYRWPVDPGARVASGRWSGGETGPR
jgi:gamma-glutamylcyclotransferase (GGCT)/AIG2-like uncharacterized protein YtfP